MATTTTIKTTAKVTNGFSWFTSPRKPRIPPALRAGVWEAPQDGHSQPAGSGIRASQTWQRLSSGSWYEFNIAPKRAYVLSPPGLNIGRDTEQMLAQPLPHQIGGLVGHQSAHPYVPVVPLKFIFFIQSMSASDRE